MCTDVDTIRLWVVCLPPSKLHQKLSVLVTNNLELKRIFLLAAEKGLSNILRHHRTEPSTIVSKKAPYCKNPRNRKDCSFGRQAVKTYFLPTATPKRWLQPYASIPSPRATQSSPHLVGGVTVHRLTTVLLAVPASLRNRSLACCRAQNRSFPLS